MASWPGIAAADPTSLCSEGAAQNRSYGCNTRLRGLKAIREGGLGNVIFFYPVTTQVLPHSMEEVPNQEMDRVNSDWAAYRQEKPDILNALSVSDWGLHLSTLHAVIGSLRFCSYGEQWRGGRAAGASTGKSVTM